MLVYCLFLQCLLVKGWKAGASWSFPRGKKSKDEEDHTCAVREVSSHSCHVFLLLTIAQKFTAYILLSKLLTYEVRPKVKIKAERPTDLAA